MAIKARSEIIMTSDTVRLKAEFTDGQGNFIDLDAFPTVTIQQPSGNIAVGPTSTGVVKLSTGIYYFDYDVGLNPAIGIYSDQWQGFYNGIPISGEFLFVIHNTQLPFVNLDGYGPALGDDPGFNYSQTAIRNVNLLLKSLRARLDSSGKSRMTDENGNVYYADCDIFSVEQLVSFLAISLSMFNQIPTFTFFTFEDTEIIAQFHELIVQGATLYALSSKALLERGREFQISDNSVQFNPPTVSELLQSEWSTELTNHLEKLKLVKHSMKPKPLGMGSFTITTSRHPAIARLRHLRARSLI